MTAQTPMKGNSHSIMSRNQLEDALWNDDSTEWVHAQVARQKEFAATNQPRSLKWRRDQLLALHRMLAECREELSAALATDMNKPAMEGFIMEIVCTRISIEEHLANMEEWSKTVSVPTPVSLLPAQSYITYQPKGCVLVIAPFNYPFQLAMAPAIAAITAGNTVVIKVSEMCPAMSSTMARIVPKYTSAISVIEGGINATTHLLQNETFDHIFFTGSPRIGSIVMAAAAKSLTPVTLELGGKCPSIITETADLPVIARRIMWSKWANAGQTCIATDYVLVLPQLHDEFVKQCVVALRSFAEAPSDASLQNVADRIRDSKSYARIVNTTHCQRLQRLVNEAKSIGALVVIGDAFDAEERFAMPTVLTGVTSSMAIMHEEIFGPILPVLVINSIPEAIAFVNARPKPLALYIHTSSSKQRDEIMDRTSSGAVVVNDCMMHYGNAALPFGGIGTSGMGAYHGKRGFDAFSHERSVLHKSSMFDLPQRYPPYSPFNERIFEAALSRMGFINSHNLFNAAMFVAGAIVAGIASRWYWPPI